MTKKETPEMKELEIVYMKTDDLIPYARNSREHSAENVQKIVKSIKEYGFISVILLDGENGIIAGHGRVLAAKILGMERLPTIEASHLTPDQRKAYVIADNKLSDDSTWNSKILISELMELKFANYDLPKTGFDKDELDKLFGETSTDIAGEIVFSDELGEAHNYVVIYFDNELDWISAKTHFDLKSVYGKRANGQPWSKGVGRVINGAEYLKRIKEEI